MGSPSGVRDSAAALEIDHKAIQRVARELRLITRQQEQPLQEESWSDPRFWNVNDSRGDRCQYLALGNAINFRFWSLCEQTVVPSVGVVASESLRGAMYMWRRLRLALQRGELSLDAHDLAGIDEGAFRTAFQDDAGLMPLCQGLSDRVDNIRNLGARLEQMWGGSFANVVDAAEGSLDRFTVLSSGFRAFDDPVQKLTMLNAIMLQGSGLATFDRDPLPAVDYHLVKQAARRPHPPRATRLRQSCARDTSCLGTSPTSCGWASVMPLLRLPSVPESHQLCSTTSTGSTAAYAQMSDLTAIRADFAQDALKRSSSGSLSKRLATTSRLRIDFRQFVGDVQWRTGAESSSG